MADVLDELLQGGSVDPSQLSALLRNQKQVGMAGQLSGSQRLAPVAGQLAEGADATAAQIGQSAQGDALARWRQAMQNQAKMADTRQRAYDREADRQNRLEIQGLRGRQAEGLAQFKNDLKGGSGGDPAKTLAAAENTLTRLEDLAGVAQEGQRMSGTMSTGLLSATSIIPGSPARKLDEWLVPLKSNEALNKLQELRAEAAALGQKGSGLGQVTEKEIMLLMGAQRSLESAQGEEQLDRALAHIESVYRQSIKNIRAEIEKLRAGSGGGMDAELRALLGDDEAADDSEY